MAFNLFKKKKEKESGKAEEPKKAEKIEKAQKPEDLKMEQTKAVKKAIRAKTPDIYGILESPHISEKGTYLQSNNKYVFKISSNAVKPSVKNAVEGTYNVKVSKVNIISVRPKPRRRGATAGLKKGYKKAIVTLAEGEKIEITPH